MKFTFMTAASLLIEQGVHKRLGEAVCGLGKKALVLHGGSLAKDMLDAMLISLESKDIGCVCKQNLPGEPEAEAVDEAVEAFIANGCDFIIAVGGGSVIDTGKAASGIATNGGKLKDYLEGVGIGKKITCDPVPFVAVPTTHGTGAEVTKNAVISSKSELYKKSIRDDRLLPKRVVIDAELMTGLPQKQTASCSMDALTQLIEAYTSVKSNPMTDALCLSGIQAAAESIYAAYDDGSNVQARECMAYASLLSGICLANAGLGAVHGIAPALGINCGISHGESCAVMLDHVMRVNLPYVTKKYADIGRILTAQSIEDDNVAAQAAIDYVARLKAHMGIPVDLKYLGIKPENVDALLLGCSSNSMNANPVKLDKTQLRELMMSLI